MAFHGICTVVNDSCLVFILKILFFVDISQNLNILVSGNVFCEDYVMDNTSIIAANFNEPVLTGNLRNVGLGANAAQNTVTPKETASNDTVELSEQSLQASQANTETTPVEEEVSEETTAGIAQNESEMDTGTQLENEFFAANGVSEDEGTTTNETITAVPSETPSPAVPGIETEGIPGTAGGILIGGGGGEGPLPGALTPEEAIITGEAPLTGETETEYVSPVQTTEGSVVNEPESTLESPVPAAQEVPEELLPEPSQLEEQIFEIERINELLNNASGQAGTGPAVEVQQAAEPEQYQEQVLLQTLGTQIAQAVPPPSIISVLG
jgi:hypothetical protein